MEYLEIRFSKLPEGFDAGLLLAELAGVGFDSFQEEDDGIMAFISRENYDPDLLAGLSYLKSYPQVKISVNLLEDKNWNEEWERNYPPVTIAGKCHVRAPFHAPSPGIPFEIIIEPKMSFGTAHHATTRLMAGWLMELDVIGKTVLDMGCGTGILAILANKSGASFVTGMDNDEWAYRNALDNFELNGPVSGDVRLGDASGIGDDRYDLILANINRNVLLTDMPVYALGLKQDGLLLMSGFYEADGAAIRERAVACGLTYIDTGVMDNWVVMLFSKSDK